MVVIAHNPRDLDCEALRVRDTVISHRPPTETERLIAVFARAAHGDAISADDASALSAVICAATQTLRTLV